MVINLPAFDYQLRFLEINTTGWSIYRRKPGFGGFIEIPAGDQAELKMGGLHIMCINKLEDFEVGAVLPLTLSFEKSGDMTIDIEIREP